MVGFPNIKINLGLNVIRRRADGYHDLDTVMFPLPYCDILEVLPGKGTGLEFSVSGLHIPGEPKENLVVKAWDLFSARTGADGARVHLHKVVPPGSGLGGGSSDAAFALMMMNQIFQAGVSEAELLEMASRLGSDCPFFILNRPSRATGRGEALSAINPDLSGRTVVLVLPGIPVPTKWAYSQIIPREPEISPSAAVMNDILEWRHLLRNDFEGPVFEQYPAIRGIRDELYRLGAVYAAMSGSGSAVYGIFEMDFLPAGYEFPACSTWQGKIQ